MLYFEPTEMNTADCTVRFTAKDGDTEYGSCDLLLHDQVADLVSCALSVPDPIIGEGLFRAALHYAANRGYYIGVCSAPQADAVRARLAFLEKDGRWCNDIPTLLTGHCCEN